MSSLCEDKNEHSDTVQRHIVDFHHQLIHDVWTYECGHLV